MFVTTIYEQVFIYCCEGEFMENNYLCEEVCIHSKTVEVGADNSISEELATKTAELFKILGDSTRIKILNLLSVSEMCVCDITALLNITQSAVSHQLKTLRHINLVKFRKEGKMVY